MLGELGDGADDWGDRHRVPGPRGRGGTGSIGNSRGVLCGDFHARVRVQHRGADNHGQAQRRAGIPAHGAAVLPRHILPDGACRRSVRAYHRVHRAYTWQHDFRPRNTRCRLRLYAMAHLRPVLRLPGGHVPGFLHKQHTDQDAYLELGGDGAVECGVQLHTYLRQARRSGNGHRRRGTWLVALRDGVACRFGP